MKRSRQRLASVILLGSAVTGFGATFFAAPGVTSVAEPKWLSDQPFAAWRDGGFIIYNNEWNKSQAGPQLIWANSYHDWGVRSVQAGTSVKTYPSVQKAFSSVPLTSFSAIRSTFAQALPASGGFEAAYDIWLAAPRAEVMFWVDNHGQTPVGRPVGTAVIHKQRWSLWRSGDYFAFVLDHNETSGSVDLLAGLRYLTAKGWLAPDAQIWQVDFGWEICSTNGVPENFKVTGYSLTAHWAGESN